MWFDQYTFLGRQGEMGAISKEKMGIPGQATCWEETSA